MTRRAGAPRRRVPRPAAHRGIPIGHGMRAELFEGPPLGAGVVRADDRTLLEALRRFDPDRRWPAVRSEIRPMLPRLRPYPPGSDPPARLMLPPGILVGFGLDLGPMLAQVTPRLVESWGTTLGAVAAQAVANVRELSAACDRDAVVAARFGDIGARLLQTRAGVAASLLLVPDELRRWFGAEPALFVAPTRDLLIRLPADTDPVDAAWIGLEIEALDPNCLHLGGFAFDGAALQPMALEDVAAHA